MNNDINYGIRELKKEMGGKSLEYFAKTYFQHYCKCNFASFHMELFNYLTEIKSKRGKKLAIAAPRGNAKSSIVSLIYVLWCICYDYEKCIVICSSTRKQSERLLTHIKDELTSNKSLKEDFPEVCGPPNPRWGSDDIVTKNEVNVIASSVGHRIRGIRHKESRPSLIICDDVEAVENVRSQEQREKVYDWFTKVVLNLGSATTNYLLAGTILHFDSLLAKLISHNEFPGWEKMLYKSVIKFSDRQDLWDKWGQIYQKKQFYKEESGPEAAKQFFEDKRNDMLSGTKVLWSAKETYYNLMVMREQKGRLAFDSEKQNEPRDTSGLSIDMKKVTFWEDKHHTLEDLEAFLGNGKVVFGACDPAIGMSKRNDYSAIDTVYLDPTNKDLYVVDANLGRWDVNTLAERICMQHKTRRFTTFVYEANAAQAWLGDIIKEKFALIPIKPVTNFAPKESRIMKLMVLIEQGKIKLSKRLTELNRQLEQYPYGSHDDGIDALSMVIDIAENFSKYNPEDWKAVIDTIKNGGSSENPKKITFYGGASFHDPFNFFRG